MAATKIRSRWVEGFLEFFGITSGATIAKITESGIEANITGNVAGMLTGGVVGMATVEKADNYSLAAAEKVNMVISGKMTVESKTLILGLEAGQIAFVYNHGTITYTVKNVAADTGTALATTKLMMVVGSATADASMAVVLN